MLSHDSFPHACPDAKAAPHHLPVPDDAHVLVPEEVTIACPKATIEQICVPASINGRDLSAGRP